MPKKLTTNSGKSESKSSANPRKNPDAQSAQPGRDKTGSPLRRRQTARLSLDQVTALDKALAHSFHINLPPTRHLTIDWELGGVLDGLAATGRFLKLLKDGARRHGWKVAYLWVREHGDVHGDHVHILLHLPLEAYDWFKRRKPGWLKLCGARPVAGLSKTQPIIGAPTAIRPDDRLVEVQRYNVTAILRYLAKHGDERVSQTFGIVPRGDAWVTGKRVSVSQNLNTKARSMCVHCTKLAERNPTSGDVGMSAYRQYESHNRP